MLKWSWSRVRHEASPANLSTGRPLRGGGGKESISRNVKKERDIFTCLDQE